MSGASLLDLLSSTIRSGIEPQKLFELYVPGFKSIRHFFAKWLRIDLTKVLSVGFLCLLYMTTDRAMLSQLYEHFLGYFTSTVSIPADDRINREVLTWMSEYVAKRKTRFLAVQSTEMAIKSPYGSDYISAADKSSIRDTRNVAENYDQKLQPIHYFPAVGKVYFLFHGRPFIFDIVAGGYTPRSNSIMYALEMMQYLSAVLDATLRLSDAFLIIVESIL
jgi:chaperone BCS1